MSECYGKRRDWKKYVLVKQFGHAFLKLDAWCKSTRGDGEEGEVKEK